MNKQKGDVINALLSEPYISQRQLAAASGYSLGLVNRTVKELIAEGYLDDGIRLTEKARREAEQKRPQNAIILAAGFGMRMVPINMETPKGLLEVRKEPLIERLIRQLLEVGIRDISVVVGFMKEQYEYLMDEYGVELIVNAEYAAKNNLHSLNKALPRLSNTYIVPCDVWCRNNPFRVHEMYSWYMVSDEADTESTVRVNRRQELAVVPEEASGNRMVGIAYMCGEDTAFLKERVAELCRDSRYDGSFWEEALYWGGKMAVAARVLPASEVVEINTYEQLRELDHHSNQLKTDAIRAIADALHVKTEEITDITVLKKGMTNRSFLFQCRDRKYIMRIPGEGTDRLIDRKKEAAVYRAIAGRGICDEIAYINPDRGYKITEFLDNARVCDPFNPADIGKCMKKLREFHHMGLKVEHTFDILGQILFYESLWQGAPSVYRDYRQTRDHVLSLREYIEAHAEPYVLTHIDAVHDNFLFCGDTDGKERIYLIDWEYAGMQDPHVDLAMFCVYAMYDRAHVDALIDAYFPEGCPKETRIKIYCYIAACGLLWSNWCEYKRSLGVEFGEYSLRQYRFAKDYYRIVQEELENERV